MKHLLLIPTFLVLCSGFAIAQTDTIISDSTNIELLSDILEEETDSIPLLPSRMIPTQRLLWGERGLMRNFDRFELTPGNRQRELKLRRSLLVTHQVMGFITLGEMIGQAVVGSILYSGNTSVKTTHEVLAVTVNVAYFSTASLALFSPPKAIDERKGFSSIKAHKVLAIVHLTGMITTDILAGLLESNPELRPYHRAAAWTTFGALTLSMAIIKF